MPNGYTLGRIVTRAQPVNRGVRDATDAHDSDLPFGVDRAHALAHACVYLVCISNHTRPTGNQSRAEASGPGAHIELSVNPLALIDVQRRKLTPPSSSSLAMSSS